MLDACPKPSRPQAILASPEAFALYVPETWEFDVLVVDEASQLLLSSAAAAYRCLGKSSFAAIVSKCRLTSLFHSTGTLIQP